MRIALITGEFPPMQGGVGAFTERLAQALATMGHEIHVITHRAARPMPTTGVRAALQALREPVEWEWGMLHPVARHWRWSDVSQIAQLAIRYEFNVLNLQYQAAAYNMRSPAINLAPWRWRGVTPVVVTYHDLRTPYLFPKAGWLREYVVRLAAQKSRGVIATNDEDRRTLEVWTRSDTKVTQIPIGSNVGVHVVDGAALAGVRHRLGIADSAFLTGYFGFLNASKGADLLVEAMAHLPEDVHLVFIGGRTGSSDQKNNQLFAEAIDGQARALDVSGRVHWTGFLPDRALSATLQACDLLAMPYRDGASLRRGTLMAALAHGKAVVTTRPQSPVPELVHGRNVWLAPRDDAAALAEAVLALRHDAALREQLGREARSLAQAFSWTTIAARTADFFVELGA